MQSEQNKNVLDSDLARRIALKNLDSSIARVGLTLSCLNNQKRERERIDQLLDQLRQS